MSVYIGESFDFDHDGFSFRAEIQQDDCTSAPWEESDGHCEVTRVNYGYQKKPSEVFVHKGYSRQWSYVTDFAQAVKTARAEGWNAPPYDAGTKGEKAVRAVLADIEYLRGWCADDWHYVVVGVTRLDDDGEPLGETEYLGGCESCGDYVRNEIVHELAAQIVETLRDKQADEARETVEREY